MPVDVFTDYEILMQKMDHENKEIICIGDFNCDWLVVVDSLLTVNPTRRPRGAPRTRAMRGNDGINFVFPTPPGPRVYPSREVTSFKQYLLTSIDKVTCCFYTFVLF